MCVTAWVQGVSATFEETPLVQNSTRGVPLTAHLNIEQRALARRLRAQKSVRDIAKQIGCSSAGIDVMLRGQIREARPVEWTARRGALSIAERGRSFGAFFRGTSNRDEQHPPKCRIARSVTTSRRSCNQ